MKFEKQFIFIIVINISVVLVEIFYGIISNSSALLTDAIHNLSDIFALLITFVALYLANKYNYARIEMMATFNNSLFLMVVMLYIVYESLSELIQDVQIVDSNVMIIVATVALITNSLSAYLLHKIGVEHIHEHNHTNQNIKSSYLHFLADTLLSFAVIVGGIVIYYFQIHYIDKILSLFFSVIIIYLTFPLLKESFFSLMDMNQTVKINLIENFIKKFDEVENVENIRVIEPSSKNKFFYAHIILNKSLDLKELEILNSAIELGLKKFGITHSVIQPILLKNSTK